MLMELLRWFIGLRYLIKYCLKIQEMHKLFILEFRKWVKDDDVRILDYILQKPSKTKTTVNSSNVGYL